MNVSRQAIYQYEDRWRRRQEDLEPVLGMVMEIRRRLPRLGTRKLYHLLKPRLKAAGIKLGRDGLFDYLRGQRLLIKPRRSYTKTTYSKTFNAQRIQRHSRQRHSRQPCLLPMKLEKIGPDLFCCSNHMTN